MPPAILQTQADMPEIHMLHVWKFCCITGVLTPGAESTVINLRIHIETQKKPEKAVKFSILGSQFASILFCVRVYMISSCVISVH